MSGLLLSLSISLSLLGCAIYGLTAMFKPLIPSKWRANTRLGRFSIQAVPIVLGGLLGVFAMPSLVDSLSSFTGSPEDMMATVNKPASFVMGIFAGTFATQLHNAISGRIKKVAEKK